VSIVTSTTASVRATGHGMDPIGRLLVVSAVVGDVTALQRCYRVTSVPD
jgi:hypothetical protein